MWAPISRPDEHGPLLAGTPEGDKAMMPHAHFWVIESPAPGRHILQGTCACGAARGFTGGINEETGQSYNQAASKRSTAWKAQATLRILAGEATRDIAAELGKNESTVRKVKRHIQQQVRVARQPGLSGGKSAQGTVSCRPPNAPASPAGACGPHKLRRGALG